MVDLLNLETESRSILLNQSVTEGDITHAPSADSVYDFIMNIIEDKLADSGWIELQVNSNFYNYTENGQVVLPLQYRKIGNIVQIMGLIGLNADLTVGQWTIGTLPSSVRPSKEMSFVCELNNNGNLWTCIIKPTGEITFNRLRNISSNVTASITYSDDTTDTVNLATNNGFINGTKWVDTLKVNVVFMVPEETVLGD